MKLKILLLCTLISSFYFINVAHARGYGLQDNPDTEIILPNELTRVAVISEYLGLPNYSSIVPTVYKSIGDGDNWTRSEINRSTGRVRSIVCEDSNSQFCVAVGESYSGNGNTTTLMAYNSSNGGISWISHNLGLHGGPSGLTSVTCKGEYCVAVGASTPVDKGGMQPIVFTSTDRGSSWTSNYPEPFGTFPSSSALRSISCTGNNGQYCIAVGDFHEYKTFTTKFIAYTSTDAGLNWSPHTIGEHDGLSLLQAITCSSDNSKTCIAVGYAGDHIKQTQKSVIYKSTDAGKSWESYVPYQTSNGELNGITCNSQYCIAVGAAGTHPVIYISRDGGENWLAYGFPTSSISAQPMVGLNVNLVKKFSEKGGTFDSVICNNNGEFCTIIGHATYAVGLLDGKNINVVLPLVYKSRDSGNHWDRKWPVFVNKTGLVPAIEAVGIDITGSE